MLGGAAVAQVGGHLGGTGSSWHHAGGTEGRASRNGVTPKMLPQALLSWPLHALEGGTQIKAPRVQGGLRQAVAPGSLLGRGSLTICSSLLVLLL